MLRPSIFGENLFDDFMDDFRFSEFPELADVDRVLYGKHGKNMMKTDVKELDNGFEVDIDLPGFKKDEIRLQPVSYTHLGCCGGKCGLCTSICTDVTKRLQYGVK